MTAVNFIQLPPATEILGQFSTKVFDYYVELLGSSTGVLLAVGFLVVAAILLMFDRAKWACIALILHVLTYSIDRGLYGPRLQGVFDSIASAGQILGLGITLVLLVPTVAGHAKVTSFGKATVALFFLQLVLDVRMIDVFGVKGLLSLGIHALAFIVLGVGISRWLSDHVQAIRLVKAVAWGSILTLIASFLVLVIYPSSAIGNNRFYGSAANPIALGMTLALCLPFLCALRSSLTPNKGARVWYAAIIGVLIVATIATGSRGPSVLILVGLAAFYRRRLSGAMITVLIASAFAVAAYSLFTEQVDVGVERLASTEDTRAAAWSGLTASFLSSPLVGIPQENPAESSYLSVAAGNGLVGLAPLAIFIFLLVGMLLKLLRRQREFGEIRPLADLAIASISQLLVLWVFEGALLGTLTAHLVVLYSTLAVSHLLITRLKRSSEKVSQPVDELEDGVGSRLYSADPSLESHRVA
jgi:hypothetical protein